MGGRTARRWASVTLGLVFVFGATACPVVGSGATPIPRDAILVVSATGFELEPRALSDDGSTAVYSYRPSGYPVSETVSYVAFDVATRRATELGNNGGEYPAMGADVSDDGRYVSFISTAQELRPEPVAAECLRYQGFLPPVAMHCFDIYVHDLETGITTPVTADAGTSSLNSFGAISGDGRYVGYRTEEGLGGQNFSGPTTYRRWDRETGVTEVVDHDTAFPPPSHPYRYQATGEAIAPFELPDDYDADIYVTDTTTGAVDKITDGDITLAGGQLLGSTRDGNQVFALCSQPYPRTYCLFDRVTHARRNVPAHPDLTAVIDGDATHVFSAQVVGTGEYRLLIRPIPPYGG